MSEENVELIGARWKARNPPYPRTVRLLFSHSYRAGAVEVEVGVNTDPQALGCPEEARGFPFCRAVVVQDAKGYADALGWIQLVDSTVDSDGFAIDPFAPLGPVSHPFCFFGFAPTLFDAPWRSERRNMSWTANSFLCGIGQEFEAFALLGFSWGFTIGAGAIKIVGPAVVGESGWNDHLTTLRKSYPAWHFRPGFRHS